MNRSTYSIPFNTMADAFGTGIYLENVSMQAIDSYRQATEAHRDDYYLFCMQDKGITTFEIDFQRYEVKGKAIIFISPNQVHRVVSISEASFRILIISRENLYPALIQRLQEIAPAKPLQLDLSLFSLVSESLTQCIKFFQRKHEPLYHAILKDSCNTLANLIASQYLVQRFTPTQASRFERIAKAFSTTLEKDFIKTKKPSDYAKKLSISTAYLNECVKKNTGQPVSYHIQQRVILEAKRLLYHADKSIKEIAAELGYDDYPYFSRLFTKIVGETPLFFRNKNHY